MKTLNLQQMEGVEGGRFWGWECSGEINNPVTGQCMRECTYYILGNPAWSSTRFCSNLPGRYGR